MDKKTIIFKFFATFSNKAYHWNLFLPICNNFSEQNYFDKIRF